MSFQDLYKLSAGPKVVDITKRRAGCEPVTERANPVSQLVDKTAILATMQRSATEVRYSSSINFFEQGTFVDNLHDNCMCISSYLSIHRLICICTVIFAHIVTLVYK